ncbi:MAG: hypothetical protein ABW208_07210 [Pyrinomonadaceae bacterium]
MSPLVTLLGIITAVAFAVAPEMTQIDPTVARYVMLAGVAAAAAGRALDPRKLRRGISRRGSFARRKTLKVVAVIALVGALASAVACDEPQLRAGASVTAQAAREARTEINASLRDGTLTQTEADTINPVINRLEKSAQSISEKLVGYDQLDAAGRRTLLASFIDEATVIATDFDALHIKSEKTKRKIGKVVANVRRGAAAFRVVQAAIPQR